MGKDSVSRWAAHLSGGTAGQGVRFTVVGSLATAVQLGLFAFLSGDLGALAANVAAWLVSTLVANAAHQHLTFRAPGSAAESDPGFGIATSLAGLGLSSLLLAVLAQPDGIAGTVVLIGVNCLVGVLRFVALRWWLVVRPISRVAAPAPAA